MAEIIRDRSSSPPPSPGPAWPRPRLVDLDPACGLPSRAARLDRLIRTILADPRTLDPKRLEAVAARAARLQDPVAPDRLVDEAIARVEAWARSPLGREVGRAGDVLRAVPWAVRRTVEGESILFRGRSEFLYARGPGKSGLVILSDPTALATRERLRLLLAALAANEPGRRPVDRADWVRLGDGTAQVDPREFDEAAIDRITLAFLDDPASPSPFGA